MSLNVETNTTRIAADMASQLLERWPAITNASTRSEGSPSQDGRYWAFIAENSEFEGLGIFVWDLLRQQLHAALDTSDYIDYVTMSPSGRHVVVGGESGVVVHDRDLLTERPLNLQTEHSDIAISKSGDDVYVSLDFEGQRGPLIMFNLDTGVHTELLDTYINRTSTAFHISGKAYAAPGWVLVSTYDYSGNQQQWLHEKLFALELVPNPRVVQLAHHHARRQPADDDSIDWYFREPHATVNRDFSEVLFSSNWRSEDPLDVDTYLVALPDGAWEP